VLSAQGGHPASAAAGGFVSVEDAGAKGDGVTDDTASIQSVYNLFCSYNKPNWASGTVLFPPGNYKITSPIVMCGNGVRSKGAGTYENGGAQLVWAGPPGLPMMVLYGGYRQVISDLSFTARGANYAIWIVSDQGTNHILGTAVMSGTHTVAPNSMAGIGVGTLLGIDNGTSNAEVVVVTGTTPTTFTALFAKSHSASATLGGGARAEGNLIENVTIVQPTSTGSAIGIGNVVANIGPGGSTSQASETMIQHCTLTGGDTGLSGVVTLDSNNTGNTYLYENQIWHFQYGIDLRNNAFANLISGGNFEGNTLTDIRVANTGTLTVEGIYTEPGRNAQFVFGVMNNASPGSLNLIGNHVAGTSGATYIINYGGDLTMVGNQFYSANSSAKLAVQGENSNGHPVVFSAGNFYQGAATWAPIYDTGGNPTLPNCLGRSANVTSLNDRGGTAGRGLNVLANSLSLAKIISHGPYYVSSNAILNAADADVAVGFRDHANHSDIQGLAKDASDVVFVGGSAGIGLNSAAQIGNGTKGNIQAPAKGTGNGPETPSTVVGWVPVKVGNSTYFLPLMK